MNRKERRKLDRLARTTGAASIPATLQAAVHDHREGRLRQAEKKYRQVLTIDPNHFDATHLLGVVTYQNGDIDTAIAQLRAASTLRQDDDEVFYNLGMALAAGTLTDDALLAFDRALEINPAIAKAPFNAAVMLHDHGRPEAAVEKYRAAIASDPGYTNALINLGIVQQELGLFDDAEATCRRAIETKPGSGELHCNLGVLLHDRGKFDAALAAFETAIQIEPTLAQALIYKGHLLHDMERLGDAVDAFRAGMAQDPALPGVRVNLGDVLREKGDLQQAEVVYRQSIEQDADPGEAYRCLAEMKKFPPGDPIVELMTEQLAKTQKRGGNDMDLHYALAKVHQDLGNADVSFAHLGTANALKRATLRYDVADDERLFEHIATVFDRNRISQMTGAGYGDCEPIFIIGMPRSGTTLVEQILASHSRVDAGGEMTALSRAVADGVGQGESEDALRHRLDDLAPSDLIHMGRAYQENAKITGGRRKTDKMPANFINAGLINLILPKARIIHCMRDPVDTCLSCLQRLFGKGQRYSYDQVELGRYYVAYDRLMAHWRDVLGEKMYQIRYEDLIADQEGETRKMLKYCGLSWENACLNFHETDRAVRTASAAQVRRPIYDSSVRRWEPFRHQLSDLLDALGPAIN